jgi:hypothetical protein
MADWWLVVGGQWPVGILCFFGDRLRSKSTSPAASGAATLLLKKPRTGLRSLRGFWRWGESGGRNEGFKLGPGQPELVDESGYGYGYQDVGPDGSDHFHGDGPPSGNRSARI